MSKKPSKPSGNPEYSPEHRYNVMLEEMSKKFDHFGEGLTDVQEKVSHIPSVIERLDTLDGRVSMLEIAFSSLRRDVSIVKSDVLLLKGDTSTIKSTMATKTDIEELSRRLTSVESR